MASGAGLETSLAANPAPVEVVLTMGGARYCAQFGGTVAFKAAKRLTATNAPAPADCP